MSPTRCTGGSRAADRCGEYQLQVLDLATASGLLDPANTSSLSTRFNRCSEDDPRWDLLPVTTDGPSIVPLRDACPFIGREPSTASGRLHAPLGVKARITKAADVALSDTHLGYRLAAAGAVTNPEFLLEYQRRAASALGVVPGVGTIASGAAPVFHRSQSSRSARSRRA
jgi:hypothetical protein